MVPVPCPSTAAVPPPSYQRALKKQPSALQVTALTLVTTLPLLDLCRLAVWLAHQRCPPPLPTGPGGKPRTSSKESLLLIALRRTLWRRSSRDRRAWLRAWPALALAYGLPLGPDGQPCVPSPSQQCQRATAAGAPPDELRFVVAVRAALRRGVRRARDLILASAPLLAWRRRDPEATVGHAPAHQRTGFLRGCRAHPVRCRASGLPLCFIGAPANAHAAPCAKPLLAWARPLDHRRPRLVRLDAASWGLTRSHWMHVALGAVAVVPWNPKRQKNRDGLPPTWTAAALGQRGGIERCFGRVCRCFGRQRPPVVGWSAVVPRVALADAATSVVALAAHQAGRPDLLRSPTRVLAHLWEGGL